MTEREALKMALEFIEQVNKDGWILADFEPEMYATITAIKEVLAQPEQKPFGYVTVRRLSQRFENHHDQYQFYPAGQSPYLDNVDECHTVYTTPPQRTWVGLTADELNMIGDSMRTWNSWTITDVYFAIEAKLKEKNT